MNKYVTLPFVLFAPLINCTGVMSQKKSDRPNIILFLVDDLGWKDTGCYGSKFYETPAVDKLALEGVRFTNAYSAHPVSGPSRAAILSGKYPLRLGNTRVVGNLPSSEKTIAEAVKEAGYSTFFAGKWHVGMTEGRDPLNQGFDYVVGLSDEGQPGSYFYPYKDTGTDWSGSKRKLMPGRDVKGLENGKEGEYLTDRLTDETIKFIDDHREAPFFIYLSHYAVHTPLEAKEDIIEHFYEKNRLSGANNDAQLKKIEERAYWRKNRSNPVFAAMIKSMDESLCKLVTKLEELKLSDNTIIIFTSDNGGLSTLSRAEPNIPTSNLPLRYGKGWNYEGGIRVPAIIKWTESIPNKSTVDYPICLIDLYPTILEMAGIPENKGQYLDGISLVPIFAGSKLPKRNLYWYFPYPHGSGHLPSAAIQDGDYKLIWHIEDNRTELYNLDEDVAETMDISRKYQHKAHEMTIKLRHWIEENKLTDKVKCYEKPY